MRHKLKAEGALPPDGEESASRGASPPLGAGDAPRDASASPRQAPCRSLPRDDVVDQSAAAGDRRAPVAAAAAAEDDFLRTVDSSQSFLGVLDSVDGDDAVPEAEPYPALVRDGTYYVQADPPAARPRLADAAPRRSGAATRSSRKRAFRDGDEAAFDAAAAPPVSDDENSPPASVRVSPAAACAFCAHGHVDTQLMPCGHLFHGQCLRPWLEATVTTPVCPCCSVSIANCVLASTA